MELTNHVNNIDPNIKFMSEEEDNDKLLFLDTLACHLDDATVKVKVYRKHTHTLINIIIYPLITSLEHKLSAITTILYHAESMVTDLAYKETKIAYVKNILKECGYTDYTFFLLLSYGAR